MHATEAGSDDRIVGRVLPFYADPAADVPDGGMEKEQRFDQALQQVYQQVEPSDMGQFMRDQHRDLIRR